MTRNSHVCAELRRNGGRRPCCAQYFRRGAANLPVKNKSNSAQALTAANQRDAQAIAVLTDQGNALYQQGQIADALERFRAVLALLDGKKAERGKRVAIAHYNAARALAALGETEPALDHYRSAILDFPRFPQAHNNLGMLLNELGRYEEAGRHFHKAIAADPLFASAYYGLGVSLQSLGDDFDATFAYQKALNLNPDFYAAWVNLGLICYRIGSLDVAVNCYTEAIALEPQNAELYHSIGIAYMAAGQLQEAVRSLGRALELQPDFEAARDALQEAMLFEMAPPAP